MEREALIRRLMATFLAEYEDQVGALDRDLLAFEKDPGEGRAELVQRLFRTMHSLKGAARSVSVAPVESACHGLEAILVAARDGIVPLGPERLQLLFEAADALRDGLVRLRAGESPESGPLAALQRRLDALAATTPPVRDGPPPPAPVPVPAAQAASAPPPPPVPSSPAPSSDGLVRVTAAKLDSLLARSGELLVARRRAEARHADVEEILEDLGSALPEWRVLEKPLRALLASQSGALARRGVRAIDRIGLALRSAVDELDGTARGMALDLHALDQVAGALEAEIREVRMLPFRDACYALERLVRDLAQAGGKQADLVVQGGEVELDRSVLEGIRNPLAHLVRNAMDHGIEPPGERIGAGKPATGRVTVTARRKHDGIEIVVEDDGRGVAERLVREQAARKRIPEPADERELLRLIFLPGFSTARMVTEVSGRGVGLDVVRHGVEALHGSVEVRTEPGRGTSFALELPLTVATVRALLVGCGGQVFAIPSTSVRRLVRVGAADLGSVEGREVLLGPSAPIPVASLAAVLGLPGKPGTGGGKAVLAVIAAAGGEIALAVDGLLAEQELLVKDLGPRLRGLRLVSGATLLPSGAVALLLDPAELVLTASTRAAGSTLAASLTETPVERKRRLLVVEDSVTTRTLERSILEAAGYEVAVAADGAEGWRLVQESPPDLVIADVEMPRLDGFGLTEAIRASRRFHALPVILVTALASEADQARGLAAGASAYLVKSAFDQRNLLETVSQLL